MVRDWDTLGETPSDGNKYIYFYPIGGWMKSRGGRWAD